LKILVCVKQVPEVTDAEVEIAADGRSIESEDLSFDMGEWDACAVEAAVRLTEEHGGEVTVLTVGDDESEAALRKGLAMGAGSAARVEMDGPVDDPLAVARLVAGYAAGKGFDLVLTGVMAEDAGHGAVGPALGELLAIPHATMAIELTTDGSSATVTRELEEGLRERIEVPLPAVLSAQTGLAEPRYVSIMGIRKTRKIPIESVAPAEAEAGLSLLRLSLPPAGKEVEILEGAPTELGARVVELVEEVRS
jgi:electron transfer flavoprotein beta subunit